MDVEVELTQDRPLGQGHWKVFFFLCFWKIEQANSHFVLSDRKVLVNMKRQKTRARTRKTNQPNNKSSFFFSVFFCFEKRSSHVLFSKKKKFVFEETQKHSPLFIGSLCDLFFDGLSLKKKQKTINKFLNRPSFCRLESQ